MGGKLLIKMTKKLINKIDERIEILKLLTNPGYKPIIFNYPYESNVDLKKGENQKPIFNVNEINYYKKNLK